VTSATRKVSALARAAAAAPASALWALEYEAAGLHPIRLKPPQQDVPGSGKSPTGIRWQTRPLDLDALLGELCAMPRSNLGLRMGRQPNGTAIVALDVDDADAAAVLFDRIGAPPRTMRTETGRGRHLFYRVPLDVLPRLRNFTKRDGIDLRTEGGQVAAAPSVHFTGARYRTTIRPVAELPAAWLDWLLEAAPGKEPAAVTSSEDDLTPLHDRELDLSALLQHLAPAGVDDGRHDLARAIGGWAGKQGFRSYAVARAVALLPSDCPADRADQARQAAERARVEPDSTLGWTYLARRFPRKALRRLEKANQDPWLAGFVARTAARLAANDTAPGAQGETDATGLHLHPGTGWPWIVQRKDSYWIHDRDSGCYVDREYAASELVSAVTEHMAGLLDTDTLSKEELCKYWVRPIRHLRSTYTAREHTYDSPSGTLTLAALRWTTREATRHAHVDRWLRALFGSDYGAAAQWLAAVTALDRPAPCIYLAGPKSLGKSLLASGLAALWSRPDPVAMVDAIKDFNASTGECPLIFTDEGFPERLNFEDFKRVITQHSRSVNAKYRSPVDVEGCGRFMIAANNEDVLRYQRTGTLTKADLDAIADRLLVVTCHVEARSVIEGYSQAQLTRWAQGEIAEHVLWLAQTVALEPSGRMAAKPGGGERILANVVAGRSAEILTRIRECLGTGIMGEQSGVHVPKGAAHRTEVWVNVSLLLATFNGRVTLAAVKECCDSLKLRSGHAQGWVTISGKSQNLRWRVLDRKQLDESFATLD
jgi:hypothetical protein